MTLFAVLMCLFAASLCAALFWQYQKSELRAQRQRDLDNDALAIAETVASLGDAQAAINQAIVGVYALNLVALAKSVGFAIQSYGAQAHATGSNHLITGLKEIQEYQKINDSLAAAGAALGQYLPPALLYAQVAQARIPFPLKAKHAMQARPSVSGSPEQTDHAEESASRFCSAISGMREIAETEDPFAGTQYHAYYGGLLSTLANLDLAAPTNLPRKVAHAAARKVTQRVHRSLQRQVDSVAQHWQQHTDKLRKILIQAPHVQLGLTKGELLMKLARNLRDQIPNNPIRQPDLSTLQMLRAVHIEGEASSSLSTGLQAIDTLVGSIYAAAVFPKGEITRDLHALINFDPDDTISDHNSVEKFTQQVQVAWHNRVDLVLDAVQVPAGLFGQQLQSLLESILNKTIHKQLPKDEKDRAADLHSFETSCRLFSRFEEILERVRVPLPFVSRRPPNFVERSQQAMAQLPNQDHLGLLLTQTSIQAPESSALNLVPGNKAMFKGSSVIPDRLSGSTNDEPTILNYLVFP